jgi:hypothetical protein
LLPNAKTMPSIIPSAPPSPSSEERPPPPTSRDNVLRAQSLISWTRDTGTPSVRDISSSVGARPCFCVSSLVAFFARCMISCM